MTVVNAGLGFKSPVASGGDAHVLDTTTNFTAGNLFKLQNNNVDKVTVGFDGSADFAGTLDVTGAVTLDSTLVAVGDITLKNSTVLSQFVRDYEAAGAFRVFQAHRSGAIRFDTTVQSNNDMAFNVVTGSAGAETFTEALRLVSSSALVKVPNALETTGAATLDTGANGSSFGGTLNIQGAALGINTSPRSAAGITGLIDVTSGGTDQTAFFVNANRTSAGQAIHETIAEWNGTKVARIRYVTGSDTTNKDEGRFVVQTAAAGGTLTDALTLDETQAIKLTFPNTSAGTGLVVASNDGSHQEVFRDSSTLAHKSDIGQVSLEDARRFLAVDAISYEHRGGHRDVGFGAEHVHDAGLEDVVTYVDGEPMGFKSFGRGLIGYHHRLIQDHEDRISRLESALA